MSKIYIAGKITGISNYKKLFKEAEKKLTKEGNICMNPSLLKIGFKWKEYMHICLAMIDVCDTLYMISNWQDSMGAIEEHIYAIKKGKKIRYEGKE